MSKVKRPKQTATNNAQRERSEAGPRLSDDEVSPRARSRRDTRSANKVLENDLRRDLHIARRTIRYYHTTGGKRMDPNS